MCSDGWRYQSSPLWKQQRWILKFCCLSSPRQRLAQFPSRLWFLCMSSARYPRDIASSLPGAVFLCSCFYADFEILVHLLVGVRACVCRCTWGVQVRVHVYAHQCGGQKTVSGLFSRCWHLSILLRQFSTRLGRVRYIWPAGPQARLYFTVLRLPVGPTMPGFKRKTKTQVLGLNSHPRAHKTNTLLPELTPNLNQIDEMGRTQIHCLAFPSFCFTRSQRIYSNCIWEGNENEYGKKTHWGCKVPFTEQVFHFVG